MVGRLEISSLRFRSRGLFQKRVNKTQLSPPSILAVTVLIGEVTTEDKVPRCRGLNLEQDQRSVFELSEIEICQ